MTAAQICITSYLIVGALAAALLWMALVASKRRNNGSGKTCDHMD